MSRTGGIYQQKTPNTDGRIILGGQDFQLASGGGTSTFTRIANGQVSQHIAASQADVFFVNLSQILFRTGQLPFLQEQFGTAAGVAGPTSVANTNDPDAQIGPPPQTGTLSITPQTGFLAKGIKVNDITLKYLIGGTGPLTVHTIGLAKSVFANNAAIVTTNLLANATNGLQVATQANPYVTKVTPTTVAFITTDLTDLILELDVTTPAATTYDLFSVELHVSFNFN